MLVCACFFFVWLFVVGSSLLFVRRLLFVVCCLLYVACCLQLFVYSLLFAAFCL